MKETLSKPLGMLFALLMVAFALAPFWVDSVFPHPDEHAAAALPDGEAPAQKSDEHWSLVMLLDHKLLDNFRHAAGPSWLDGNEHIHLSHVFMGLVVLLLGLGLGFSAFKKARNPDDVLLPETRMTPFTFFDILVEGLLGIMEGMMPREKAYKFLPLVASFFVFILFSNALALVPGMLPATDNLNTTLALGLVAFIAYNWWGIQAQGAVAHFKHLLGPIWWLAPLMLIIELISHCVRPISLALRLMGNMFGDHMVLGIFLGFAVPFVPLPVMMLGTIVIIVQAVVFTLLTIVYIAMAVEEHEHHHDEAHAGAH
jgi:F-type H+-transporting ATPase subunit a